MRISRRQLKRIIKEEYTKLKRRGLISEIGEPGLESYGGEITTIEVDADAYGWNSYEDILATIQDGGYALETTQYSPGIAHISGEEGEVWLWWQDIMGTGEDQEEEFEMSIIQ